MRKLMSFLLTIVLACSLMPAPALAEMVDEVVELGTLGQLGAQADMQLCVQEGMRQDVQADAQIGAQTSAHTSTQADSQNGAQTDTQTGAQTDVQAGAQTDAQAGQQADSALQAQGLYAGIYTDGHGIAYELEWSDDGAGLSITFISIPAGEGDIDLVLPSDVSFQASDGETVRATV